MGEEQHEVQERSGGYGEAEGAPAANGVPEDGVPLVRSGGPAVHFRNR
ncbi:hypothetical protein IHE55_15930 [Streptomyces pactum]|uniref:Uncharacterized protein n=1 Tax=Streptomyces pactum TaxID=68249 RepID=A0ABS0NLX0_9ACTN|nr:hypothetical protein [Streptomyces pactum]MBH5336195.1 hypothetical protein [Streptomyces pactum]